MKKSYIRIAAVALMFLAMSVFTVSCGMKSSVNSRDKSSKSSKSKSKYNNKRMNANEYK